MPRTIKKNLSGPWRIPVLKKAISKRLKITWADTERGRGPTGTAIRTGKVSMCRNMLTDPQFKPWRDEAIKRGYASSIALPFVATSQRSSAH